MEAGRAEASPAPGLPKVEGAEATGAPAFPGLGDRIASVARSRAFGWTLLGVAMVAAVLFLGYEGRGQTFQGDELGYQSRFVRWPLITVLFNAPPDRYLLPLPLLLYGGLLETFETVSYLPYRLAGIAFLLLCSGLFFAFARRRVGDLLALPPAILLLLLGGAGAEVALSARRLPMLISIAFGLGALLALDRRDRRGDGWACGLLLASVLSHPVGFMFATAAAVLVLARPSPERWRRSWVFLAPLPPYLALSAAAGSDSTPSLARLDDAPAFIAESLAVAAASLFGALNSPLVDGFRLEEALRWALALAVISGLALAVRRKRSVPVGLWAAAAALLALWVGTAVAPGDADGPETSRYVYPGALFLLIALVEALRRIRFSRLALAALGVAFGFAMVANVLQLQEIGDELRANARFVRAELAALELARPTGVPPGERPEHPVWRPQVGDHRLVITVDTYFRIADRFGSPAMSPTEVARQPEPVRRAADLVLARALEVELRPVSTRLPRFAVPAREDDGTRRVPEHGCVRTHPRPGRSETLSLPEGGALLRAAAGPPVEPRLTRFSDTFPLPLLDLHGGSVARLSIPEDAARRSWRLLMDSDQPVIACGVGRPRP